MSDPIVDAVPAEPLPPPPRGPAAPWRPSRTLWLLVVLLALLAMPYLVQRVQFAMTLGRERAEAQAAKEFLADMPEGTVLWSWVAKAVAPSVVGVKTDRGVVAAAEPADEWQHLFGPQAQPWIVQGEGSGVIVDAAGYVVTNYHVIRGAVRVRVRLADGRTIDQVEVVGVDPPSDVALLKIDVGDLVAAPWGDSDRLDVGDAVLAVGDPFGLEGSVTSGIVSAKGRTDIVPRLVQQNFLQTDAAVNPGNSGGPLVNRQGQVVGINTAIRGESYQGISFAIPSNMVRQIVEQLKTGGHVARGWLGVAIGEVTEPLAERLKLDDARGALVVSVVPGAPAARAGVRPNDVILQWNDTPIRTPGDLSNAAASTPIGAKATLSLVRDGKPLDLEVTITQRPE
ncbi:MAG: trypsin-like peptidase domain-containing protein [Pirellulales bacterium]|nr:trypsin-like peptidase domain-containing protein [Pirellulales bacterium]